MKKVFTYGGIVLLFVCLLIISACTLSSEDVDTLLGLFGMSSEETTDDNIVVSVDIPEPVSVEVSVEEPEVVSVDASVEVQETVSIEASIEESEVSIEESEPEVITYKFRSKKYLTEHYEKHGIDMGFASKEDYLEAANKVINNPDALHKLEKEDGDDIYYLEATNEFVVVSTDGYIRTYFCPDSGKKYYDKQ